MQVAVVGSALAALVGTQFEGIVNVASGAPVALRDIIFASLAGSAAKISCVRVRSRRRPTTRP
jgi:hypothetical protein